MNSTSHGQIQPSQLYEWNSAETYIIVLFVPIIFVLVSLGGLWLFKIWSQHDLNKRLENYLQNNKGLNIETTRGESACQNNSRGRESPYLLNNKDNKIIEEFKQFQNNTKALFKLYLPVVWSLAFCPILTIFYPYMVIFFWPGYHVGEAPKINDVLASFLMPAGILYAVAFGFTFQNVLFKRQSIESNFLKQVDSMNKILAILQYHKPFNSDQCLRAVGLLRDYTISVMVKVMAKERDSRPSVNSMMDMVRTTVELTRKDRIWKLLEIIRETEDRETTRIDKLLSKSLFQHTCLLYEHILSTENDTTMNFSEWLFVEVLGYISFFGILLLDPDSFRLQQVMCVLTVLTISSFSYILSDVDCPYHGVFRLDLPVFVIYMGRLEQVHKNLLINFTLTEKDESSS